ncbi:MAG: aminoacetone oxidase family FAD-binding enzyme [Ignavibacteriae bacterium]|nr:aminoacetone oxidase family FAD-binding enzyme [Ignavibacteriota bacterium]
MEYNGRAEVIVVGAGAAGLLAAIFAAEAGADTLLVERTSQGGKKILASGGGRCNILPSVADAAGFTTDSSKNTLRNILLSFPLDAQRRFFEETARLPLVLEEESGKYFPASHRARDVRDVLRRLAAEKGVSFLGDTRVTDLRREGDLWLLAVDSRPDPLRARAVVLATGGLSVPSTGSDGFIFPIARRLGLACIDPYPALTPLYDARQTFASLSGLTILATVSATRGAHTARATGGFLFTHRGYSGPAVLDVSHVVARARRAEMETAAVTVSWLGRDEAGWSGLFETEPSRTLLGVFERALPARLAAALLNIGRLDPKKRLAHLTRAERASALALLAACPLPVSGTGGYAVAEVTGGGVALGEVAPKTLQCRAVPGLFLCGELLDAFGPIGGHNFQWAWSTGRAAGLGAAGLVRG